MMAMLDIIISFIVGGILLLAILSVNANLTDVGIQSSLDYSAQVGAIDLGQVFEYDLYKIGYHASNPKITFADTVKISYKADFENNGTVDTVTYYAGTTSEASTTPNPRDFPLYRQVNNLPAVKNYYGLTWLRFTYYDSTGAALSTPMSLSADLQRIKSIRVQVTVQSTFPYDTTYSSAYWERTFFPMNL